MQYSIAGTPTHLQELGREPVVEGGAACEDAEELGHLQALGEGLQARARNLVQTKAHSLVRSCASVRAVKRMCVYEPSVCVGGAGRGRDGAARSRTRALLCAVCPLTLTHGPLTGSTHHPHTSRITLSQALTLSQVSHMLRASPSHITLSQALTLSQVSHMLHAPPSHITLSQALTLPLSQALTLSQVSHRLHASHARPSML